MTKQQKSDSLILYFNIKSFITHHGKSQSWEIFEIANLDQGKQTRMVDKWVLDLV